MISYSEKAKAHIEAQRIKEEEVVANKANNTKLDSRAKLEKLRRSFPRMMRDHKYDCKKGDVITYRHARPSGHFFDHSKAHEEVPGEEQGKKDPRGE